MRGDVTANGRTRLQHVMEGIGVEQSNRLSGLLGNSFITVGPRFSSFDLFQILPDPQAAEEIVLEFEAKTARKQLPFFHRRILQNPSIWYLKKRGDRWRAVQEGRVKHCKTRASGKPNIEMVDLARLAQTLVLRTNSILR